MPSITPGEDLAAIWQDDNCNRWRERLERYDIAIAARDNARLTALDSWFRLELPARIAERETPRVYLDELVGVTAWKMHRGVWRENNRRLVESNPPEKVEETSTQALAAVPDPRKPVALLSTLAGVGPATASAVLAAYAPGAYPFFDEIVAAFIPGLGPVSFTLPYYLRYAAALREKADMLNARCSGEPLGGGAVEGRAGRAGGWTAHDLSQALWAAGSLREAGEPLR